eukprot:TRINITY_DN3838_c0_g1_i1.p1 TRINITY_DN3838_c0_g1~~TRINITY_DN3838_c0_g1_i1.p1  ORF type:complete len:207 (-),score=82.33 TRINITY_DN3838_c0_g1_i1:4-567(-)
MYEKQVFMYMKRTEELKEMSKATPPPVPINPQPQQPQQPLMFPSVPSGNTFNESKSRPASIDSISLNFPSVPSGQEKRNSLVLNQNEGPRRQVDVPSGPSFGNNNSNFPSVPTSFNTGGVTLSVSVNPNNPSTVITQTQPIFSSLPEDLNESRSRLAQREKSLEAKKLDWNVRWKQLESKKKSFGLT